MSNARSMLLGVALGFALGISAFVAVALAMSEQTKGEYLEANIVHDGWCLLMPSCADRCHCHDKCGVLCNTWRQLVYDGKVEPFGYEWTLNDPTGLVECIVHNSNRGKMMIVNEGVYDTNGWQAVDERMKDKNRLNDAQAWKDVYQGGQNEVEVAE